MSGGFFRGTSAEQDTRFSNKQAKLLKSQKFAPELEHLVDMTKVKMDVIKPWIATRVTELLGFEDEVLINFIYGLLDAKDVNGKEIQIQLTGFMEKNTVKFMKELWTLLLSAQMNASGVPQQFLDAKEEETRKKKEDSDRIENEIQKKREKESRELDQERSRKMDGNGEMKSGEAELVPSSRRQSKFSQLDDERDAEQRNGVQRRKRASRSPRSAGRSLSPPRSRFRSPSKSPNSRSDADNNRRSRSPSRSPETRRRSISLDRVKRSSRSPRRSRSPVQRRFRSPYNRRSISKSPRGSRSPVRRRFRSPYRRRSPYRCRSPYQRRSPYPVRRSPSPGRHPSPRRRRSPSTVRRRRSRSPPKRRESPSPHRRRRSPLPVRRRSPPPMRRRSPSPIHQRRQRSPSTPRRDSPSPVKRRPLSSSGRRSLTPPRGRRSLSPYQSSSPSSERRGSPSPVRRKSVREQRRSPSGSPRGRESLKKRLSPIVRRPSSIKSVNRDTRDGEELRNKGSVLSSYPEKSPTRSKSPPKSRKTAASEDGSPHGSPSRQRRERMAQGGNLSPKRKSREFIPQDSPESSREDVVKKARDDADRPRSSRGRTMHSPDASKRNNSLSKLHSPERLAGRRSTEPQNPSDIIEPREKYPENKIEKSTRREVHPGTPDRRSSPIPDQSRKTETVAMSVDNDLEEKDMPRSKHKEKRKHKRSGRQEATSDDDDSSDSDIEDRREAKRRKKEERRLRKEEKRRRREERHRKREERRLEKRKLKNQDDSNASDGEHISKKGAHSSDDEETISDQKRLEIELREKALESLKAKKGISH